MPMDPLLTQFCGQVVQVLPVALPPFREWLPAFGVPAPGVQALRPGAAVVRQAED